MDTSKVLTRLPPSPIATTCLLIGILLLLRAAFRRRKLSHIPGIRYGSIPGLRSLVGAYHFMRNPFIVLKEGAEKYPEGYFRVSTLGEEYVVVNDAERFSEYLTAPDNVLSTLDAINIRLQVEWTMGPGVHSRPYHIPIVRTSLTRNVGNLVPKMQRELVKRLDAAVGRPEEWKELAIHDFFLHTVARLSNLAFGGEPLAYNDEFIKIATQYTIDVIVSAAPLQILPRWLKDYAMYALPPYRSKKRCERIIGSYIKERLEKTDEGKPAADDMLQWLIDSAPPIERTVPQLVERMVVLNFASIHTTTMTLTNVVYTLCQQSEKYLAALRAEIQQHCGDGQYTKESLEACSKLDSFVRECMRVGLFGTIASARYAKSDYTFKDGTFVPAGCMITGSMPTLQQFNIADAEAAYSAFDGFRYSQSAEEGVKQQMTTTTGSDFLPWGYGRHACPGRYFASAEMRLILANMIQRYDMKLKEGTRPMQMYIGSSKIPETKLPILVRHAR